ncbi:MAG TPA: hypothetical protein VIV06_12240 [Candidatus Limnocylindrales bacterium]
MNAVLRRWQAVFAAVVLSVVLGGLLLAQGVSPSKAVFAFGVAILLTIAIGVLQGRSETAAVLAGNPVDERQRLIHLRAWEIAGQVTIVVSIVGYVAVELGHGDSTGFAIAAAAIGFGYIAGVIWLRSRV